MNNQNRPSLHPIKRSGQKKKLVIKRPSVATKPKPDAKLSIRTQITNKKNAPILRQRPQIAKKTPETAFDEIIGKLKSQTHNETWETPPENIEPQKEVASDTKKPKVKESSHPRKDDKKKEYAGKYKRPEQHIRTPKPKKQRNYSVPSSIDITEHIQIGEFAKKLRLPPNVLIAKLMRMGEMATISKIIDHQTATLLASEFNCKVNIVSLHDTTVIETEEDKKEDQEFRPPVVTIMGHVDHGKTSLLDAIRESNITATESGAITQHIGAYQIKAKHKDGKPITFIDTPGHEAFTAMRARGASVTDIVILVVAADDGLKQQTIEAISHARNAKLPIIVAINKVDLPAADINKVEQQLMENGLSPESMGGDTLTVKVSAKTREGLDDLLETITLQSQMLGLMANQKIPAMGVVLEARIDLGRGPTATILIKKGILRIGDAYVADCYSGTVRAMFNDLGKKIVEARPSTPVEIIGLETAPDAGEVFQVVENEKYAREIASKRKHYNQMKHTQAKQSMSFQKAMSHLRTNKELNLIVKADKQGSIEAICDSINKIPVIQDVKINIVYSAIGSIIENDVNLAIASSSLILGFHVRSAGQAQSLMEQHGIKVQYYKIIYNLIEDVRKAIVGLLEPDRIEELQSRLEVRDIFKISKLGEIAGCMVTSGKIHKNHKIRLLRSDKIVYTGNIKNLKRLKDDVTEVKQSYECGVALEKFNDIQVGDLLESFTIKEVAPSIESTR